MGSWTQSENVCGCVIQENRREKKERKMGHEIIEEESLTDRGILNQKKESDRHSSGQEDRRTRRERERKSRVSF